MAMDEGKLNLVTHKELLQHIAHDFKREKSLFVRGGTGTGKTWSFRNWAIDEAARLKRQFLCWHDLLPEEQIALAERAKEEPQSIEKIYLYTRFETSNKMPEDIGGIPDLKKGYIVWVPALIFWLLSRRGAAGMLFLDEYLKANQAVRKPLADVFLNKRINELRLARQVGVCGASNLKDENCDDGEHLSHEANRMGHMELRPMTADEWIGWAKSFDKVEDGVVVDPYIDPRITMMLGSCPEMIYHDPANRAEEMFCTHRAWHDTSDLIKGVDHDDQRDFFLQIVAKRVGTQAAGMFQAVLKHDMSVHGPQVLKNAQLFHDSDWDRQVAFTMWMSAKAKGNTSVLNQSFNFLNNLGESNMVDTIYYMMKANVGAPFVRGLTGTNKYPEARKVLLNIAENLKE